MTFLALHFIFIIIFHVKVKTACNITLHYFNHLLWLTINTNPFNFYMTYKMVFFIFVSFKICNSRLHCQCDAGYVPPNCAEFNSSPGGSIDDGFWDIQEMEEEC